MNHRKCGCCLHSSNDQRSVKVTSLLKNQAFYDSHIGIPKLSSSEITLKWRCSFENSVKYQDLQEYQEFALRRLNGTKDFANLLRSYKITYKNGLQDLAKSLVNNLAKNRAKNLKIS